MFPVMTHSRQRLEMVKIEYCGAMQTVDLGGKESQPPSSTTALLALGGGGYRQLLACIRLACGCHSLFDLYGIHQGYRTSTVTLPNPAIAEIPAECSRILKSLGVCAPAVWESSSAMYSLCRYKHLVHWRFRSIPPQKLYSLGLCREERERKRHRERHKEKDTDRNRETERETKRKRGRKRETDRLDMPELEILEDISFD